MVRASLYSGQGKDPLLHPLLFGLVDYFVFTFPEKFVNSVGAGDSMVAGFIAGYVKTQDYLQAFKMGVATGSASAFSKNLATADEVELLLKTINEVEYEY